MIHGFCGILLIGPIKGDFLTVLKVLNALQSADNEKG
jgi:hypothetical protein